MDHWNISGGAATHRDNPPGPTLILMLLPAASFIVVLFGGGLFYGFLQACGHTPGAGFTELTPSIFISVLQNPDFFSNLLLTLYISTASTLIAAVIAIIIGLFIKYRAENSRLIQFILQIPLTVPHLAAAIAFLFLLSPSGLVSRVLTETGLISGRETFPLMVNDPLALSIIFVYVWKEVPFLTFMILAILKNSGDELLEAAATLKASRIQRFRHVTLPLILPGLSSGCLIVFAFTFGAFEVPYLLGRTFPTPLPVWAYRSYSDVDLLARPEGIAIGILIAAVVTAALFFAQALSVAGRRRRGMS